MLEIIEPFFRAIAWPMEPPRAYGAFHILFTGTGFLVCGFSAWKLRNIGSKAFGCILFFCGLFLSLSEVLKQFFCYFIIMDCCYSWGDFPFQLCSIPMYLCLIVPWLKPGNLQRSMCSFMVLYNLLGGRYFLRRTLRATAWLLVPYAPCLHLAHAAGFYRPVSLLLQTGR